MKYRTKKIIGDIIFIIVFLAGMGLLVWAIVTSLGLD